MKQNEPQGAEPGARPGKIFGVSRPFYRPSRLYLQIPARFPVTKRELGDDIFLLRVARQCLPGKTPPAETRAPCFVPISKGDAINSLLPFG